MTHSTTPTGSPAPSDRNSLTVGPNGPLPLHERRVARGVPLWPTQRVIVRQSRGRAGHRPPFDGTAEVGVGFALSSPPPSHARRYASDRSDAPRAGEGDDHRGGQADTGQAGTATVGSRPRAEPLAAVPLGATGNLHPGVDVATAAAISR